MSGTSKVTFRLPARRSLAIRGIGTGGRSGDHHARRIEAAAPSARAVIWPDVAHMIGMEAPDRLNALIVDFLASLRPWE